MKFDRKRSALDKFNQLALRILFESREELARADGKASILLAASSLIASVVLAAILAGEWRPSDLAVCFQWAWWTGSIGGAVGIVSLAWAVYPRTKYRGARPPKVIAYFGDVILTPGEHLEERLRESAHGEGALLDQLKAIAWAVDRKYRGIQIALWAFAVSTVLCVGAVVADRFVA